MYKKNFIKTNSVYIGGGYSQSQLLWLIPLVDGYCSKKEIKNIIFENALPSNICENKLIRTILSQYNIKTLKDNLVYTNLLLL